MNTRQALARVYKSMKTRCYNSNAINFKDYGARGIDICPLWLESFSYFYNDMLDSYRPGLEIDRIDNDKGYSPENCRWVTRAENCRNTRSSKLTQADADWIRANPEGLKQTEMAERLGVGKAMVNHIVRGLRW